MTVPGAAETPTSAPDRVFKWVAVVAGVCLVGFIVVRGRSRSRAPDRRSGSPHWRWPPPPVLRARDDRRPAFSLPTLRAADPVSLSAFRGKPVIVNFFASWCRDCRAELAAVATRRPGDATGRVAVVGVDSNETSEAAAERLLAAAQAAYPVAVDAERQGGDAVPRPGAAGHLLPRRARAGWSAPPSAPDRRLAASAGWPGWRGAGERRPRDDRGTSRASARPSGAGPADEPRTRVDRAAALAEGRPGSRPSSSSGCSALVLVLSLGGLARRARVLLRRAQPAPTTTPTTAPVTRPAPTPQAPAPARSAPSGRRSGVVHGRLQCAQPTAAPAFTLTDQHGRPTSVPARPPRWWSSPSSTRPATTSARCWRPRSNRRSRPRAAAAEVEFVTVNTDPSALAQSAEAPGARRHRPRVHCPTGTW